MAENKDELVQRAKLAEQVSFVVMISSGKGFFRHISFVRSIADEIGKSRS